MFYDKYNLSESKLLKGREINIGKLKLHTHNMIAGSLFILAGIFFMFYNGTGSINGFQMFGLKDYYYIIQRLFSEYWIITNVIGLVLFGLLSYLIGKHYKQ